MLFVLFAVMNVIKGIFVEAAAVLAAKDRDAVIQEELAASRSVFQEMREVFQEIDTEKRGSVTWEQFEPVIGDERVMDYFDTFGIDDPYSAFRLCENGEKRVHPEEF